MTTARNGLGETLFALGNTAIISIAWINRSASTGLSKYSAAPAFKQASRDRQRHAP